jgi:hypothetical protein
LTPGAAPARPRRRLGAVSLVVALSLVALVALASLGVDAGLVWAARAQLQNAADAAALAAATHLIGADFRSVTGDAARQAAEDGARAHRAMHAAEAADGNPGTDDIGFEIGAWDADARLFTPRPGETDADLVSAVRVSTHLDEVAHGPVPAFLARVLGRQDFPVSASAVAYVGFAGGAPPGTLDLPIAVHECAIRPPSCPGDFCSCLHTHPFNACELSDEPPDGRRLWGAPQLVDTDPDAPPISCLEFHSDNEQTSCWTNYQPDGTITPGVLEALIIGDNDVSIASGDVIALDNGNKTPVFGWIGEQFALEGQDRYLPQDGAADSWIVKLPVISCPEGENACEQGSRVTDFVCFEIRQVERVPPGEEEVLGEDLSKEVRGRVLCKDDPFVIAHDLFADCAIGGATPGGGPDLGIRAQVAVLVD